VNHEIKTIHYIDNAGEAAVRVLLGPKVQNDKATEQDFILIFRDQEVNRPICIVREINPDFQSISIQIIPDQLTTEQRMQKVLEKLKYPN